MIVGEKVVLEEIDRANIEQLRVWRNQPELRQWFREYKDITPDKQEQWYSERGNNTNPAHVYFQIMSLGGFEDEPNADRVKDRYLVGACGLHYIDFRLRSTEFGIFLGRDRNQGKGKEALTLLFDYGFKELNLHKIWGEVYSGNDSLNLYKQFMKEDGILRDNFFHNGKYGDSIVVSVLENEWRNLQGEKDEK
jgi:RimJ/RimL family protein N-acetyltransferase